MDGHELSLQMLIGPILVWLVQLAKSSNWRIFAWVSEGAAAVCRVASGLLSVLVAGGLTYTVTKLGDDSFNVFIHVPAMAALAHFAVGSGVQLVWNEMVYKTIFNKSNSGGPKP